MLKATVLRGPVLLQGCSEYLSLKWLAQGILEIGQRLDQLGAVHNQLYCPFFFSLGKRVLCFAQNGGEDLEGSFNSRLFLSHCNFPSFQTLRNIYKKRKRGGHR